MYYSTYLFPVFPFKTLNSSAQYRILHHSNRTSCYQMWIDKRNGQAKSYINILNNSSNTRNIKLTILCVWCTTHRRECFTTNSWSLLCQVPIVWLMI